MKITSAEQYYALQEAACAETHRAVEANLSEYAKAEDRVLHYWFRAGWAARDRLIDSDESAEAAADAHCVPPPTFDPKDLRDGDLVKARAGTYVVRNPIKWVAGVEIERVWRLDDESGDYRLIFPPREVQ